MPRLEAITSLAHPRFSRTRTSFRPSTLVLEVKVSKERLKNPRVRLRSKVCVSLRNGVEAALTSLPRVLASSIFCSSLSSSRCCCRIEVRRTPALARMASMLETGYGSGRGGAPARAPCSIAALRCAFLAAMAASPRLPTRWSSESSSSMMTL